MDQSPRARWPGNDGAVGGSDFPEFGDFIISFQMPYRLQRDIVERVWVGRAEQGLEDAVFELTPFGFGS
jgi:hypothetical protein